MPTDPTPPREPANDGNHREDEPIPSASEDEVLEETVRLTREGLREREADPREPKSSKE